MRQFPLTWCTGTEARNFIAMKISKLLATRQALLRQTQLANLAFAFVTLQRFAARIEAGKLSGLVRLRPADPSEERFWATLTALEGNQSVLEEHFADHELIDYELGQYRKSAANLKAQGLM